MPSHAFQAKAVELAYGQNLSKEAKLKLKNESHAVALKTDIHKQTSSFGGRNNPVKIAEDAADQKATLKRDIAEVKKLLKTGAQK